jgi:hypothetical protein
MALCRQARDLRKTPVRIDSNARFFRRPRIILKLTIFAVIGTTDFALCYWAEEPGGVSAILPLPCAGGGIAVRVAVAGPPDASISANWLTTVQASFSVGINSQLDGIVQDVLTDGELLVNTRAGILRSSTWPEATK